jgi:carnitine monooxygenase subunit
MEGENTFVFAREIFDESVLAKAEIDLVPCRVELWGGCAFINFDDDAPALLDCIAPVAKVMDVRNVENMRVEWWSSTVLPTNWKLAMEAFMEGYHVMRTHPQLHEVTIPGGHEPYAEQRDSSPVPKRSLTGREAVDITVEHFRRLSDGMGGMIHANDVTVAAEAAAAMELPEAPDAAMVAWISRVNEQITSRAQEKGIPMPDLLTLMMTNPAAPVQFVFPHYFMLPMFGNMASYRIRPLTAETCLFELWSLTLYPDNITGERPVPPVPVAHDSPEFPAVPQQDYSNLPLQQLGLHAKGFEHMRLSAQVEGLISNYQRLIDGYLQGLPPGKLLTAMQSVCGPYDAPIHDLGI